MAMQQRNIKRHYLNKYRWKKKKLGIWGYNSDLEKDLIVPKPIYFSKHTRKFNKKYCLS